MKRIMIIVILYLAVLYGLTLQVGYDPVNVEEGLTARNRITYRALLDSIAYNTWQHKNKTANHEKADATTYYLTANDSVYGGDDNLYQAATFAVNARTYLVTHMANDSAHCGSGDTTTTVPDAIDPSSVTYAQFNTFVDTLLKSQNAHLAQTISTRYKIMLKEEIADFIAHCALDTVDGDSVHYLPDTTYNTVVMDSTGDGTPGDVQDSLYSAALTLRNHYHGHLSLYDVDGSEVHQGHNVLDSLTCDSVVNRATLYAFCNEFKTKFNQHCARDSSDTGLWTTAIHKDADAANTVSTSIVTGGGHYAADANTYTDEAYVNWKIPDFDRMTIQYTPAANDTANFYHYGSVDGLTYAYIDSLQVIGVAGTPQLKHLNTNFYPFMRIMMNTKVTQTGTNKGAWKIDFEGEK